MILTLILLYYFVELFCNGHYVDNISNATESEGPHTKVIPQEPFTDIVCYGIGKLTSCPIARYQFAFLLLLKEFLKVIHN